MIIQIYIIKFWIRKGFPCHDTLLISQEEFNIKWWHVFDTCLNSKKLIKKKFYQSKIKVKMLKFGDFFQKKNYCSKTTFTFYFLHFRKNLHKIIVGAYRDQCSILVINIYNVLYI